MNQRGFSLLELMVVAAVFLVVAGGTLNLLFEGQSVYQEQTVLSQEAQETRIAMDHIVRYMRHAGNDPQLYLRNNNIPAFQLSTSGSTTTFQINSDITGSIPSATGNPKEATGDPDGTLNSIHEQVVFRLTGKTLTVDIGYGETVLARDIRSLNVLFFDKGGSSTSNAASAMRARVTLTNDSNISLKSDVFLRRSSYQIFYR